MLRFTPYTAEHKSDWDAFVDGAKAPHFMHRRDYMEYHADRFEDASLLVYSDDKLVGLLPANVSQEICFSHQGLTFGGVIQQSQTMSSPLMVSLIEQLGVYLKNTGVKQLIYKSLPHIYHCRPAQEDQYALQRVGAALSAVEITTAIDLAYRGDVSSRRKRGAKKAAKAGLTFQQSDNWFAYWKILTARLQDQHNMRPVHTVEEAQLLAGRFPRNIRLFTAEQQSRILAGVVIFETLMVAHAQYIAASPEGLDVGALDGLFEYLIGQFSGEKRYLDFGISTEDQGGVLNEGLVRQKEQFGGSGIVHTAYILNL
ncbi:MAG: GNAT family N-acetyltransferase [Alphaproteobacteria bacterium]|nr:GNAT family N-acetyltransferase [Alphaproteobacteria bacterium]